MQLLEHVTQLFVRTAVSLALTQPPLDVPAVRQMPTFNRTEHVYVLQDSTWTLQMAIVLQQDVTLLVILAQTQIVMDARAASPMLR